jgi:peptide/nickel transport system substrate-binding protein
LNLNSWSNAIFDTFADASYIVSPTFVRENGIEAAYYNPVGTGPFILEEYLPNTRISFVRNENYWQEGKPYLDGFVTEFITDSLTMKAAFKANQLDFISVSLGKDEVEMRELGYETSVLPMTTYTLIPDTVNASSPFAILEVRQAVEYALDRESMADGLGYGQWIAPFKYLPDQPLPMILISPKVCNTILTKPNNYWHKPDTPMGFLQLLSLSGSQTG